MSNPAAELTLLRAALVAAEARAAAAETQLSATQAERLQHKAVVATSDAVIASLKLDIAILKHEQYGRSAERTARLLDQLELQLAELEIAATEDIIRAEQTTASTTKVEGFERRHPVKKPFPAHLPRERVVVDGPSACTCCGSDRIVKMGEDITETLEVVPRQWKVICYPAGFCIAKAREGKPPARSSHAAIASRSASLLHPSIRCHVAGPDRTCWR